MTSDKDLPHDAINSNEQENKYTFGCNQVSFILNKIRPVLFFGVIGQHSHHYLFPLIFLLFWGRWGLKLCTIYKSRPGPTLNLPHKVSLKKYHIFFIFTNKKTRNKTIIWRLILMDMQLSRVCVRRRKRETTAEMKRGPQKKSLKVHLYRGATFLFLECMI